MTTPLFTDTAAQLFPPTPDAASARLAAVRPAEYARSRNHLQGAVTRLSPYITHGFLTLPQVLHSVLQHHRLDLQHKFICELGWREYFHHVWQHEGEGIFKSFHAGPLPDAAYARVLPDDIRQGRTGVPVIDQAVRTLYATGWLHNHARMWLASYVVHFRKVHWRAGADWLYGHLLDGDLASNHLSWQWVAGTGSHKPYLFNADNVARYAPADWHSPGTVVDQSYEQLDRMVHSSKPCRPEPAAAAQAVDEPALLTRPEGLKFTTPDAAAVHGRQVQVVQPWNLGDSVAGSSARSLENSAAPTPDILRVGVLVDEFHRAWPWSAARWQFVGQRMQQSCDVLWSGNAASLRVALAAAHTVHAIADPHGAEALPLKDALPTPRLFADVNMRCRSFSQYWSRVTRGIQRAEELGHRQ